MDKYRVLYFGDTEAYGPLVELSQTELAVAKKLFGENLRISAEYGFVKLVNVSEEKRKTEARRKHIENQRREKEREARAVRDKYISNDTYGGYSMAAAFQKALSATIG